MKIVKCWNCGTRFLRIDGLHLDDGKGVLTQDTVCPVCGRTVVTTWVLTAWEKLCFGIAMGLMFGKEKPLRMRHGAAIFTKEPKPTTARFDRDKLDEFFASARAKATGAK